MKSTFNSQVFIGNKRGNLVIRILTLILAAIIILAVGIKVLVGDFSFSDISGILMALIIIGVGKSNIKPKPQYVSTQGTIEFDDKKMTITYMDINGGKNVGYYSELTQIHYDEIESIEYGKTLNCYRIVAKCFKKRIYLDLHKENIMENREEKTEVFIHVMDEAMAYEILNNMEIYSSKKVSVLE